MKVKPSTVKTMRRLGVVDPVDMQIVFSKSCVCVQVLEPQNVDPSMIQMTFLDDVVHSLLKGENIGITSRRRSRSSQNNNTAHVSIYTHSSIWPHFFSASVFLVSCS